MNKKIEKTLTKFAEPLGLSVDTSTGVIYGTYHSYKLFLVQENNNSYSLVAHFSLSKEGELPNQEEVKEVLSESKEITDCVIQGCVGPIDEFLEDERLPKCLYLLRNDH
jgi:hypothetical protein